MENQISFTADFKDAKKENPKVHKHSLTAGVYFVANDKLYKGIYNENKCYYAYTAIGIIECMASANGTYVSMIGDGKCDVCTHWCYANELKLVRE